VCTPTGAHGEVAIETLEAGKHVIIEKPAETTVAKTDEIITAQEAAGTKVAVIFQHGLHRREEFRCHSCISGIAELVVVGAGISGIRLCRATTHPHTGRTIGGAMTLIKCVRRCRSPSRDRESSSRMAV